MTMPLPWPTEDQALAMPVDDLALHVLWRLVETRGGANLLEPRNFLGSTPPSFDGQVGFASGRMMPGPGGAPAPSSLYGRAIFEAWNLLVAQGLLAPDPARDPWFFVTRRGETVAALGVDGRRQLKAERRLSFELHPRLETRIRQSSSWVSMKQRR